MYRATVVKRTAVVAATPLVYRTLWGVDGAFGLDGDAAVRQYLHGVTHSAADQRRVFDGVEFCAGQFYPFVGEDSSIANALRDAQMQAIVQVHTCGYPVPPAYGLAHPKAAGVVSGRRLLQPAWKEHADSLRFHCEDMVRRLTPAAVTGEAESSAKRRGHPVIAAFNCHGAKDSMPREDALRFMEAACQVERDVGVPVCHETHRQRLFHNPIVLQALRADLPSTLKLNADLSHFVVALERLMCDEADAEFWPEVLSEVLARRTYMMHCRVGLPQAPQLQDPRPYFDAATADTMPAEERAACDRHHQWWRTIASAMRDRGVPVRCVPEYGPPPYQTIGDAMTREDVCFKAADFLRSTL